jgi:hypothetical protein
MKFSALLFALVLAAAAFAAGDGQAQQPASAPAPAVQATAATQATVIRQVRIFAPNVPPFDNELWAETTMGRVILPMVSKHPELKWFWFSRYVQPPTDGGDTDIKMIPQNFQVQGLLKSMRFRFEIPRDQAAAFEAQATKIIQKEGCAISSFLDYDLVGDLGSDRHLGQSRDSKERRVQRAARVVAFYMETARLALDCLTGPDAKGYFQFEKNDNNQNPLGSTFETVHHVFCNVTEVPLSVLVFTDAEGKQLSIGTYFQPPGILTAAKAPGATTQPKPKKLGEVRIRY